MVSMTLRVLTVGLIILIHRDKSDANRTRCPQGWMTYRGSCYNLFGQNKTWDEAQKTCQGYGAILATIPDSGVNNALKGLMPSVYGYKYYYEAWVGLSDRVTEGTFIWLGINRRASWTNWDNDEPNNLVNNEDCVALLPDGYWNDAPCSTRLKFICEKSV